MYLKLIEKVSWIQRRASLELIVMWYVISFV